MQSIFEILFFIGNLAYILRVNLICYIAGTEGCRKLKFGEVGLHIRQKFLSKIEQKNF